MTRRSDGSTYTATIANSNAMDGFNIYGANNSSDGQRNIYFNNFTISNSGNYSTTATESRVLSGAGNLIVSNSSTLTLTSTSNFTGTTTILSGATLQLGSNGTTGSIANTSSLSNNGTFTVNRSDTVSQGAIFPTVISGTGLVTKAGSGTLTLNGSNTHSGGTTLSSGQLNINNATALGAAAGTFTISGGTIDNTTGGSITLSNNNPQAWNGDFTFTGTQSLNLGTGAVTLGASRTVTVSGSTLTVGGAIGDGGNARGLTKAGAGTLLLSGSNSYTGTTTVNAGTLQINSNNRINDSSALTLAGGTFQASGTVTDTMGALNVTSTGTIDMGSGDADFTFASLTGVTTSLAVTNWTIGTDTITFTNSANLTNANLAKITVNTAPAGINSSNQLIIALAPTVTASAASSISTTGATLTGNVTANSGRDVTERGFFYSTTNGFVDGAGTKISATGTFGTGEFTQSPSGLTASTTYYYKAFATTAAGTSYTAQQSFTTSASATAPAAPTISSITPGNGNLSVSFTAGNDGGSAITNYQYSTDGGTSWRNRASGTTASPLLITTLSTDGSTALTNGTSYNVQIRAVNAIGNGTATANSTSTPRTTPSAPTISSITAGNQSLSVAFSEGSNGGNATTNIEFSTDNGSTWTTRSPASTASPVSITGLAGGTTYTVRIRAVNAAGSGAQSGSSTGTPFALPSVTTDAASSVTSLTATLNGNITATNGASPTVRGVEYSTTNGFANGAGTQSSASDTFSTGAYSFNITGLAKNTTYYYKAYATNTAGTTYGSQQTFTTANAPDGKNPATANPTTAFLGDNKTLSVDSWQSYSSNARSWATIFGRFDNANLTSGTTEGPGVNPGSSADNTSANTPRFAQTGTFYWVMRISYGSGNDFYFDASRADWRGLATVFPSSATLAITVSALNNPSNLTATANGTTAIDLAWTRGTSGDAKDTIIVRRAGSAVATDPTQGTTYNAGTALDTGTVVYRGGASTFQDTGLTPGVTYHYKIYAENWSYYSSGVTGSASLASDYNLDVSTGNTQTQSVVSGGAPTLTGSRALNKNGGGTLTLDSSSNSYTGVTTINNGTLSITVAAPSGSNGALGNAASAVVVGSGSNSTTFSIGAAVTNSRNLSITTGGVRGLATTISSGTATQAGNISSGDFNLSVPSGGTLNVTGNIDAGTNVIDKLDSGTAIIAGTMTNTATRFDVMAGELQFGSLASIGDRTGGFLQNKFFFGGGTLGITGNITLGGDNGLFLGNGTNTIRVAADRTFEVQGYIQDADGANTLVKTGTGTLVFNKTLTNDFSHGTIAVREGTLSTWNTGLLAPNITLGDTSTAGTYNFTKGDGASTTTANFTLAAGGGGFSVTNDGLTVSGVVSGTGNLTKTGAGSLSLTGTNTNNGTITITSGTLLVTADSGLGAVPSSATAASISLGAGRLALNGAFTLDSNRGITLTSTSAVLDDFGNAVTYNGIIANSGTAALEKRGGGTLTLGGVNTYTGTTTISVGTLAITNASALGAGGAGNGTTVSSGAALTLSNGITVANELLDLTGDGVSSGGAVRNTSGNNAWSGSITINGARINSDAGTLTLGGAIGAAANTMYVGGSGNTTISGAITGTKATGDGTIFKDGTGTLTLSATNSSLSGLILIRAGTLAAATNANLTSGTIQLGNGNTTATLSLTGGDTTRSQNITVIDSSTAGVINISSGTLTLSGTLGQTGTVNTTKIGKSGGGTLRLNSANTYEGQIQIGEGTVILANNTAHGVNTSTGARAIDLGLNVGDTSMANNVALYLVNGVSNNASIYIASNNGGATRTIGLTGSGSATFLNDHFLDGNATLTGDSGTITFSGGFSNTGGLIAAAGTVVLNKANTFTGATVVNGGTLRLDVGDALQSTASVTVNSGGTLHLNATGTTNNDAPVTLAGGTLRLSGVGETLGNLTVTASSVIDLGSGTSSLTFARLSSIGAGNEIAIHNYTEGTDALIFTDATTAGANTTRFKIYSDAGTSLIADAYFDGTSLKPVPAPSAPTLGSASMPSNTTNITLNWTDLTGATAETSYEIQYSSASTFTSPTAVTGIAANSPSRTVDVGSTGTRYFRLRGVNSRGNGTWSTTQVIQLNSLAAGSTTYLSAAGTPGANTVAGIFGAANAAGLNDGANDSDSTNILLLSDSGSTANTIFYSSSASGWREGSTDRASTSIPQGTAFMLRNRSSSTDFFLLAAAPRTENFTVSVNATAGQVNLLTPARSTATALSALNLRPAGGNATNSIQTSAGAQAADVILIPQANGTFNRYHHDGTKWKSGLRDVPDDTAITVPPGGAFFIRKGPGSQFNTYHAPAE